MSKRKPFAKLFEHPEIGQVLVQRSSDDEDTPGIRVTFDAGVDQLQPCHMFLGVGGTDDDAANAAADSLFENLTEDMAVAAAEKQIAQIKEMFQTAH